MPINSPRILGKCLIASGRTDDEHGGTTADLVEVRVVTSGQARNVPTPSRRSYQLLEPVMKKSILLLLVLAAAALTGCVHPVDPDTIAPAAKTAPAPTAA